MAALQKKATAQTKTVTTLKSDLAVAKQTIASLNTTVAGHTQTLAGAAPLLAIAPYVSLNTGAMNDVKGPNIVFQGANVHVRSVSDWNDGSGLGNLIVGWNQPPAISGANYRAGANNLVVGVYHSYPSFGCFVAGGNNTVMAPGATVTGGSYNVASGSDSSVSGGLSGHASTVYGWSAGGIFHNP